MSEEKKQDVQSGELTDKELDVAGGSLSSRAKWELMMRERATRAAAEGSPIIDHEQDFSP